MQCGLPGWPLNQMLVPGGVAVLWKHEEWLCSSLTWVAAATNSRAPAYIFYQHKAVAKLLNTLGASELCSPQYNFPASISTISPSTSKVLSNGGWARHICMFPECCGQLILWTASQEHELSFVGNVGLVYLCRHVQDSRAAAKHKTFLVASAHCTCCAITGHW